MKYFLLTNKGSSISNLSYLKTIILFMVMAQWSYRLTVTDSLVTQLEILNGKNRIPVLNQLPDEFKRHPISSQTKDYAVEVIEPGVVQNGVNNAIILKKTLMILVKILINTNRQTMILPLWW